MSYAGPATEPRSIAPAVAPSHVRLPQAAQTHVLHIINGEHFSGAERVQQLLGRRLGEFGYDPVFACLKPGKFPEACYLRAGQVITTPMHGRFDLRVLAPLTEFCRQSKIRLLHAHTPRSALITSLVARRLAIPWVYHVHSPTARDSTRGMVNRVNAVIERFSIRNCDMLLTVSRSLRREMLRLGVQRHRMKVVPNGVPSVDPIAPDARLTAWQWRIGLIALMRPRKGIEDALKALQLLHEKRLPIKLDLIGNFETSEYQRRIEHMIGSLGLQDCVQCCGFTDDINSALRRLDALVLPSLFGEGMPMVVLEAISAGVPVVATRVEGTPEVIRDGHEGYLAEANNPPSLAQKLLELTRSRQTWKLMSQRAVVRHRKSFSDVRMAAGVAKAYAEIQ